MSNKYLEKVAANAFKSRMQAQGHDFTGMTNAQVANNHRLGGSTGDSLGKGNLQDRLSTRKAGNFVPDNKTVQLPRGVVKQKTGGLFSKTVSKVESSTGGVTANSAMRTTVKPAAATGMKGLLGKGVSLIKKNPLLAAGGALVAGAVGHKAMSGSSNQQYQYQ